MAKSPSKIDEMPDEADSTTLSARFNAKQREVLEKGAAILNCAPAKLIRESALQRSADVINASGDANATLRRLARRTLQPLVNPMVEVVGQHTHKEELEVIDRMSLRKWERLRGEEYVEQLREYECDGYHNIRIRPVEPNEDEIKQLKSALKTCATEFCRMMLDEWDSVESGGQSYQPKVSAADLLGGEGEET